MRTEFETILNEYGYSDFLLQLVLSGIPII